MKKSMINLNLNKDTPFLLACSFGPDSMCLFDLLIKNKIKFVVCHVNYHKRAISNLEQYYLTKLCEKNNIQIEVLDTSSLKKEGNFQNWAREIRYSFFAKCASKYNIFNLLVAHQQDDLFETYFMQKERKGYVRYYGLKEVSFLNNLKVIRPLLNYTKNELQKYDDENNVPYSLDISNQSDDYKRNFIRHHIINSLTKEDRFYLLNEINYMNKNQDEKIKKLSSYFSSEFLDVSKLNQLYFEDFEICLYNYLSLQKLNISISKEFAKELYKNLFSDKSNIAIKLDNDYFYYQEYGKILIKKEYKQYHYKIDKKGKYIFDEFEIDFTFGGEDRNIKDDDYPLTICPAKKDDEYFINGYKVSVRRLFIDFKMPLHLRKVWPIIKNKEGKIIYIPRYREKYIDNHKSVFKIKLN